METVPELKALLKKNETEMLLDVETSKQSIEAAASALRQAFTTIMTLEKETVTERLGELIKRLKEDKEVSNCSSEKEHT